MAGLEGKTHVIGRLGGSGRQGAGLRSMREGLLRQAKQGRKGGEAVGRGCRGGAGRGSGTGAPRCQADSVAGVLSCRLAALRCPPDRRPCEGFGEPSAHRPPALDCGPPTHARGNLAHPPAAPQPLETRQITDAGGFEFETGVRSRSRPPTSPPSLLPYSYTSGTASCCLLLPSAASSATATPVMGRPEWWFGARLTKCFPRRETSCGWGGWNADTGQNPTPAHSSSIQKQTRERNPCPLLYVRCPLDAVPSCGWGGGAERGGAYETLIAPRTGLLPFHSLRVSPFPSSRVTFPVPNSQWAPGKLFTLFSCAKKESSRVCLHTLTQLRQRHHQRGEKIGCCELHPASFPLFVFKVKENVTSEKMGREDDLDHSFYATAFHAATAAACDAAATPTSSTVIGGGSANER
ncbi:hypothetical protein O3P69_007617 [Scylla paramamosain]|uniref:Uncharacterized protein n=1 Tax=Scylla paramamosain TaxID=85552 RepID=A0AAW0UZ91_SCYPA